jgi:hypothetical protein
MHTGMSMHDALRKILSVGSEPQTKEQRDILEEFAIWQKETIAEKQTKT